MAESNNILKPVILKQRMILFLICCYLFLHLPTMVAATELGCKPVCVDHKENQELQIISYKDQEPEKASFEVYSGETFDVGCKRLDTKDAQKGNKKTPEWTTPHGHRIPDDIKKNLFIKEDKKAGCFNVTWVGECKKEKKADKKQMCADEWTKNCNSTKEVAAETSGKLEEENGNGTSTTEKPEAAKERMQKAADAEKECKAEVAKKETFCDTKFEKECQRDCVIEDQIKTISAENIEKSSRWTIAECDRTWLIHCLRNWAKKCQDANKEKLGCHFRKQAPLPNGMGCVPQVTTKCSWENVWDCLRNCQVVTAKLELMGSPVKLYPGQCTRESMDLCKDSIKEDRTYLQNLVNTTEGFKNAKGLLDDKKCNDLEDNKVREADEMAGVISDHMATLAKDGSCDTSAEATCERRCHIQWILDALSITLKDVNWKDKKCQGLCQKMKNSAGGLGNDALGEKALSGIYCKNHCMMESLMEGLLDSENRQMEMKIRVRQVNSGDEGQYRCQVPGGRQAKCFNLTVTETTRGVVNQWARLSCKGNLTSRFEWTDPDSSQNLTSRTHNITTEASPGSLTSFLSILPTTNTLKVFKKYKCTETLVRSGEKKIRNRVLYRVNIPKAPEIKMKTMYDTSVKIEVLTDETQVKPNDDMGRGYLDTPKILPIIGYRAEYKFTHKSKWFELDDKNRTFVKARDDVVIEGLKSGVTYYVRFAFRNDVTLGHFSKHIKFTAGIQKEEIN